MTRTIVLAGVALAALAAPPLALPEVLGATADVTYRVCVSNRGGRCGAYDFFYACGAPDDWPERACGYENFVEVSKVYEHPRGPCGVGGYLVTCRKPVDRPADLTETVVRVCHTNHPPLCIRAHDKRFDCGQQLTHTLVCGVNEEYRNQSMEYWNWGGSCGVVQYRFICRPKGGDVRAPPWPVDDFVGTE